jgi:predicted nucleic acid-binding protein
MVFHMKTTLNIDDELMAQLKREAARQKRTISELVETALRGLFPFPKKTRRCSAFAEIPQRRHAGRCCGPGCFVPGDGRALVLLVDTERYPMVAEQVLGEIPHLAGNLLYDAHTAIIMREHGIRQICTRDTDFHRFSFLEVIDPLQA